MNRFDKSKFPCAVCDQLGHTFEDCPVLMATDLKEAYLRLLLLVEFKRINVIVCVLL